MKHGLYLWVLLCALAMPIQAEEHQDYLYYRDVNIPPYQHLREFFDMPNRAGHYQVTLISDSIGPLTFDVRRVLDEQETELRKARSYHLGEHEFHTLFRNAQGKEDLLVEIANSNPMFAAKVSVIVIELSEDEQAMQP